MSRTRFLRKLITVTVADDRQQVAAEILDAITAEGSDAERANAVGDVVDDAVVIGGPIGSILEGVDDVAAAHLAGVVFEVADQARTRVLEEVDARIAALDISPAVKTELREALKLDELAA